MRLVVDLTRCQGYGQCAYLAPDVFRMHGSEALMDNPEPDESQRDRVLRAAAACPVRAIKVDRIAATQDAAPPPPPARPLRAVRAPGPAQRPAGGLLRSAIAAFRRSGRIVIVGASLAGLAAAAVMRREGFTGSLTVIGDEHVQPYDRPPLSKQVLGG